MEYVLIGLLVSIGWHIGKVLWRILDEIVGVKLHQVKWYTNFLDGKTKSRNNVKQQRSTKPYKGTMIGFNSGRES